MGTSGGWGGWRRGRKRTSVERDVPAANGVLPLIEGRVLDGRLHNVEDLGRGVDLGDPLHVLHEEDEEDETNEGES